MCVCGGVLGVCCVRVCCACVLCVCDVCVLCVGVDGCVVCVIDQLVIGRDALLIIFRW